MPEKKTIMQESKVQLHRMIEYVLVSITSFNFAEFFEKLEYLSEAAPFFNYIIAMALLLSSAFLKSNISSVFYIAILGYLQSENSEEGLRRVHKDGHYVVMLVGLMVMVHVLASLRLPDILLAQISPGLEDYCVDCPTRRFWLNFGSCANEDIAVNASAPLPPYPPPMPPYPPPGQVAVIDSDDVASAISEQEAAAANQNIYDSECKRPVTTREYSIIPDLIVMLLLAYFIRRAKLMAMSESANSTWKRGIAGVMKSNRGVKKGRRGWQGEGPPRRRRRRVRSHANARIPVPTREGPCLGRERGDRQEGRGVAQQEERQVEGRVGPRRKVVANSACATTRSTRPRAVTHRPMTSRPRLSPTRSEPPR